MRISVFILFTFLGQLINAQSLSGTWVVDSCLIEDQSINFWNCHYQMDTMKKLKFEFRGDSVCVRSTAIMSGCGTFAVENGEILIEYHAAGGPEAWKYELDYRDDHMIWRKYSTTRNEMLQLIPR